MTPADPFVRAVLASAAPQVAALRGRAALVGLSGGADSVALLHVLLSLADDLGLRVHAAHLDHALRPESAAQADELERTVHGWGLPLLRAREDMRLFAGAEKLSIEAAGRELRYRFLGDRARALGAVVAVGHNRDDQAETVLLNLARGSGLRGLTGMRPVSPVPGAPDVPLVRPLLGLSGQDIRAYCDRHALPVLLDPSNDSPEYARNRVRHGLLRHLADAHPAAAEHVAVAAGLLAEEEAALEHAAARAYGAAARELDGGVLLRRESLEGEPRAIQVRVLRRALLRVVGTIAGVERVHLLALLELLFDPRSGREQHLPGGVRGLSVFGGILLYVGEPPLDAAYGLPLLATDRNLPRRLAPGWRLEVRDLGEDVCDGPLEAGLHEHVRRLDGPVAVRAWERGETFEPLGLGHAKRVADFLAAAKAPRPLRRRVPVLACGGEIVCLLGWRLDARWRLLPAGGAVTCVRVRRE